MLLTEREQAIVCRIKEGATNREIASALGIAEAAVIVHLRKLFISFGLKTRSQLKNIEINHQR